MAQRTSLVIYLHFLGQALQLAVFKLFGLVDSNLDFRIMFEVEKTPVFYAGRLLTALMGTGTVALVFQLGRRLAGLAAGAAGAFLLAVNTFHIDQSQLIAVDVSLAFFTMGALLAITRLGPAARTREHLLTGALVGLAVSAKYTGAVLVVLYLIVHGWTCWRTKAPGNSWLRWRPLLCGLGVAVLVFAATSPYVILDHEAAWRSLSVERDHMQEGHLGLAGNSGWDLYLRHLATTIVGWPVLVVAALGVWVLGVRRRQMMVVILAVFLLMTLAPISSWAMKADRYLVPVVPVLMVLAGCGIAMLGDLGRRRNWSRRTAMIAGSLATLLLGIPSALNYPDLLVRNRLDTRTVALNWIEANIAAGSFILSEYFGPELLRPTTLLPLEQEIQDLLLTGQSRRPVYAVQVLPLFQTRAERSAIYYDLQRYPDADYLLISGSVRSRYGDNAGRFGPQLAFYATVENLWEPIREFEPGSGVGPRLSLFRNPRWNQPYAERPGIPPEALPASPRGFLRDEGFHYFSLGANAMTFGHLEHAEQAFRLGLRYQPLRPEIALNLVLGAVRVMEEQGHNPRAEAFLDSLTGEGPPSLQAVVQRLRSAD